MSDFNILDHLRQAGFGHGSSQKSQSSDKTNEEDTLNHLLDAAGHNAAGQLEHLHLDLSKLGTTGLQAALGGDVEGIAGKTIMPSILPDTQGGFLARLLHSIFIKNREITDHTGGTGGSSGSGDYSGGGGGGGSGDYGGGGGSGGDFSNHAMHHPHFEEFINPTPSFDWSAISWASLGALPRPSTPDVGPGADIGIATR